MSDSPKERSRAHVPVIVAWVFVALAYGYQVMFLFAWESFALDGPSSSLLFGWSHVVNFVVAVPAVVFGIVSGRSNRMAVAVAPIVVVAPILLFSAFMAYFGLQYAYVGY